MITNPIQYTSRTFLTALADINSDPYLVDKPDWFKRLIAGMVDVVSIWNNAEANNGYLRTALTRRAVTDLCALIDYTLAPRTTAYGLELFDASPTAIMPFTVAASELKVNGPSGMSSSALRYESRTALTFSALTLMFDQTGFDYAVGVFWVTNNFVNGEKVRVSSDGVLPSCFSLNTDYYVVPAGVSGFVLGVSRAKVLASQWIKGTDRGSGNMTITRYSRPVTVYQQESVDEYSIGISDGITLWQEFDIGQVGVLFDLLTVRIGANNYSRVDTLALSAPTDLHYRAYVNTDETLTIRFGNGVNGAIAAAGEVYVSYGYGGGENSNVSVIGTITAYAGGDSNITGCMNPLVITNGTDAESIETAKKRAPMLLKARNRFITTEDGVALILAYGGIATAVVNKNVYGVLSCQVLGIALGGGNPVAGVRTAIANYLISLSPLESIYVQFDAATLTPLTITMNVKLVAGYIWAVCSAYVTLAINLFISEAGAEILEGYETGGISYAVGRINTIFSTAFAASDYPVIQNILDILIRVGARVFGGVLEVSDLYSMCAVVTGVDSVTLVSSTPVLPYDCAANEITTHTASIINLVQV